MARCNITVQLGEETSWGGEAIKRYSSVGPVLIMLLLLLFWVAESARMLGWGVGDIGGDFSSVEDDDEMDAPELLYGWSC